MQLFKSQGIQDTTSPPGPRSYRQPRFMRRYGRQRRDADASAPAGEGEVHVLALASVRPQWEDVLASYERAA